jgi:cytoskeletal protein RodZ
MLENLERDQFQEFCAPVFVRGHLASFARAVRIDSERVISAYERQLGQHRHRDVEQAQPPAPSIVHTAAPVSSTAPELKPRAAKLKVAPRARRASRRSTLQNLRLKGPAALTSSVQSMRPTSMVAILLVICAMAVVSGVLATNRATAQNPASFPETSREDWSLEKETQESRWLLERPAPAAGAVGVEEP